MSNKTRTNLVGLFTMLSIVFTILQSAFSVGSPLSGQTLIVVSALIMFINIAITAAKQYVSKLILNQATRATFGALIVSIVLGFIDIVNVFNFSETISQWARWGLTLIVTIINAISEYLYPSQFSKLTESFYIINENGQYLSSYNGNGGNTWDTKTNAIIFTDLELANIIAKQTGNGAVVPSKGF